MLRHVSQLLVEHHVARGQQGHEVADQRCVDRAGRRACLQQPGQVQEQHRRRLVGDDADAEDALRRRGIAFPENVAGQDGVHDMAAAPVVVPLDARAARQEQPHAGDAVPLVQDGFVPGIDAPLFRQGAQQVRQIAIADPFK